MWNLILHYKEQCSLYDKVSAKAYSEVKKVQILNMAVAGTQSICNMLNIHNDAKRAAGVSTPIGWDEYVGLPIKQTEVYDSANTSTSNPRA